MWYPVTAGHCWATHGLVDPITGEGIYFAFRSAELLAETFDRPGAYSEAVANEIGRELTRASRMYKRFYGGHFLGGDFPRRMIQLSKRSLHRAPGAVELDFRKSVLRRI
jgi:flavin-dependent dehydrogenase